MKTLFAFLNTRHLLAFTVALFGLFSVNSANAQSQEITPEVRKQVEQMNLKMEECVQKKDFSTLIDLYSDDATIMVAGGKKIQGRKAIAEYWYTLTKATSMKSEILELGGNGKMVYQVGRWTITSVKDGVEQTSTTDVVLVWVRQNYDYKIQLNSSNNPVASIGSKTTPFEAAKP